MKHFSISLLGFLLLGAVACKPPNSNAENNSLYLEAPTGQNDRQMLGVLETQDRNGTLYATYQTSAAGFGAMKWSCFEKEVRTNWVKNPFNDGVNGTNSQKEICYSEFFLAIKTKRALTYSVKSPGSDALANKVTNSSTCNFVDMYSRTIYQFGLWQFGSGSKNSPDCR
jgi:hypothetical protein